MPITSEKYQTDYFFKKVNDDKLFFHPSIEVNVKNPTTWLNSIFSDPNR